MTSDSLALGDGARITFVFKHTSVATGEVARAAGDGVVVARLTSGALPREKDLGRVQILAEPAPAPRSLRVAYPSSRRATLFFTCDRQRLEMPFPPGSYRADTVGRVVRIVRDASMRPAPAWPETLTLMSFDEAADEEIAIERGEVDVAVFWPGELSSHMRPPPAGLVRVSAPMRRGRVVAGDASLPSHRSSPAVLIDDSLLTALNRELFRGDLEEDWHAAIPAGTPAPGARYEVDPDCPGRAVLERFLARAQGSPSARDPRPRVRLTYLDASPDMSVDLAGGPADVFGFTCQVLVDARLARCVRDLGADLVGCSR